MKAIMLAILLATLVFNQGCCTKTQSFELGCVDACVPETIIVETKTYIKQTIPPLPEEPSPSEFKTYILEINGQQFYAMTRNDSVKMLGNWESYKGYTLSLRNILYNLQDTNSTEDTK